MYDAMDISNKYFAFSYYLLVIVFIGLLVRNVFIAIITEAFADLRVQLSNFSQGNSRKEMEDSQVLRKLDTEIKLVHVEEALLKSRFRTRVFKIVSSKPFVYIIHTSIFVDAIIQSFFCNHKDVYPNLQIIITILFDIEAVLKIIGMSFMHYINSVPCRFEGILCIGSTICLPLVYTMRKEFALFQVLRPFRIVLLWSSLRLFMRRILGSGKKITQLSLFTLSALVIASGIFLQLFCGFGIQYTESGNVTRSEFSFDTFPSAFKATFQVFMQEAWIEIMDDLLTKAGPKQLGVLVYVFIILFHLLAATILASVFVALILDNLELNEELKIVKQRRLGQEIADTKEKLPARIRVFEYFKDQPKVINMDHVEYTVPKVRQSFVTSYLESADKIDNNIFLISPKAYSKINNKYTEDKYTEMNLDYRLSFIDYLPKSRSFADRFRKQSSVTALMQEAHLKRMNLSFSEDVNNSTSKSIYRHTMVKGTPIQNKNEVYLSNVSASAPSFVEANLPSISRKLNRKVRSNIGVSTRLGIYNSDRQMTDIDVSVVRQNREEAQQRKDLQIENLRENHPKFDESLFIFSANGKLRKFIYKIVHGRYKAIDQDDKSVQFGAFSIDRVKRYFGTQTYLDWFMLITTQISLVGMLIEYEHPKERLFNNTLLVTVEYIFIVTSSIELLLKIIADGLIFAPNALIRDFGDVLHLFIYIVSLIYVCWQPHIIPRFSGAYWLLVFRATRPLRLLTLAPPLRKEVKKVVRGYKDIMKVMVLLCVLIFIFANYGVQTFGNKLKRCNDIIYLRKESKCNGVFKILLAEPGLVHKLNGSKSILVPRYWRNPKNFNFDTIDESFLALLEMLSLEGWTEIRDTIEQEAKPMGMIYPYLYVFLACLIGLTLFIGIIVSNFNETKGIALLTVEQKRWKDLKKKLELAEPLQLPPKPMENDFRARLYDFVLGKIYGRIYTVIVLINVSTLFPGQWHPTEFSRRTSLSLEIIAMVCCFVFIIDTCIKIYAFSLKGYFLSWGNRVDFILVISGVIFILWNIPSCHSRDIHLCHHSRIFGVAIFILRFLTLSFKHNRLRMLMLTVVMGLFKSFYTIAVLFLIILFYGFMGVVLFGPVKRGLNLNTEVNFDKFSNALFLLFRIATGEDWNSLMHDAMVSKPYCHIKPDGNYWESNCGDKTIALIFFHTYTIIITYIFLNLFIAVVIENFSIFYSTDSDPIMSQQDIQTFQVAWNIVDIEKSGSISIRKARFLLRHIYEKLGLDRPLMLKRMCLEIEKTRTNKSNKVTFHNVLFIIAYKKIENMSKSLQLEERLAREELDNIILEEVAMEAIRNWAIKICRLRKKLKPKPNLRKRISGMSEASIGSLDSLDDSEYDPLSSSRPPYHFRSNASLSPPTESTNNSSDKTTYEMPFTLRRRRNLSTDEKKELRTELYSWWDDEVEDGE